MPSNIKYIFSIIMVVLLFSSCNFDDTRPLHNLGREVNERVDRADSVAREVSIGATRISRMLENSMDSLTVSDTMAEESDSSEIIP